MTNWNQLYCLMSFFIQLTKSRHFVKKSFLIGGQNWWQKRLNLWQNNIVLDFSLEFFFFQMYASLYVICMHLLYMCVCFLLWICFCIFFMHLFKYLFFYVFYYTLFLHLSCILESILVSMLVSIFFIILVSILVSILVLVYIFLLYYIWEFLTLFLKIFNIIFSIKIIFCIKENQVPSCSFWCWHLFSQVLIKNSCVKYYPFISKCLNLNVQILYLLP